MARTPRLKCTGEGTAHYHLMSRTNDRRFLFREGRVKTELVEALRRAAAFSGIRLHAYVAMDNHFHAVCEVTRGGEPVPREELLRRYGILKGAKAAEALAERWKALEDSGGFDALDAEMGRLRARMNDISEMVKTFKEAFNAWYKRDRRYCGSLWSGRFASTLVEGGRYLAVCKRYTVLNPVRAGLVAMARDYRWSWCEDDEPQAAGSVPRSAGPVPEGLLMVRVAQIGGGRILGSARFVERWLWGFGDRLRSSSACPREVPGIAFSSHGWRLGARASRDERPAVA